MRTLTLLFLVTLGACGGDHVTSGSHDMTTDSSATCPANLATAEGTPCAAEGMTCGTCTDPCQFCNMLACEGGTWTTVESFPSVCSDGGTTD